MKSSFLKKRQFIIASIATLCFTNPFGYSLAQENYPSKSVKILVGYSAGGAVDTIARTVAKSLSESLGQSFIVENKPGAGSNIAIKSLIDSEPDGYTIMLAANALAANMALYQPAPFDAERDLTPIAQVGRVPVVIAANPSAPYSTVAELIRAAQKSPGEISFASPGNGATPHMAVELFAKAAGLKLQHIPYRGGAQAITDTIGGQLPLVAVNALEALSHVKSGKLKIIATLSEKRTDIFPNAPTIAESGYPGFEASVWYGFVAPKKTPPAIINKLHVEIQKTLATQEVQQRMTAVGGKITLGTSDDFLQLIRSEHARYKKLIHETGIKPD